MSWMEAEMSGDPKKCRDRALKCRYLANEANTPVSKQMFLDLSQTWLRLAAELDDTNTVLHALNEMEFEDVLEDANQTETAASSGLKAKPLRPG